MTDGYTVFRGVAPEPMLAAARAAIEDFLAMGTGIPLEWSVVPLHHSQAQWDLRQLPAIHEVFTELLGTPRLWVSMDRAIFKAPGAHDDSHLHFDVDPRTAPVPTVQGMLFLTDAPADQGPFECVPGLFRDLDRWLEDHPDLDLEAPLDLADHEVVQVTARAGDLVVWDARLPHHGGPNRGAAPRISVPITMWHTGSEAERLERVRCWRDKRAPAYWRDWPGILDPEPGEPAVLTPLGRKLVGLDPW